MTNFIPIFPLGLVVYPEEQVNLHIFEPRYKQMISECYREKRDFGIPAVIDNKIQDFGTLVSITELTSVNDVGEMDIKTKGQKVFRILEVIKEIPDKLYFGAIVNYPENYNDANPEMVRKIVGNIRQLHKLLNVTKDFKKQDPDIKSYDVAHHVGLTLQEEYELLNLLDERQRLEYLKRYLNKVIPMLSQMESLKEKIKLNGHFKNLSGFNFDT